MSNRLTKITTGVGDAGTTRLSDGKRVSKSSLRVDAIGAVDELNAVIGLCVVSLRKIQPNDFQEITELLSFCIDVQNELFNAGGELASPGQRFLSETAVASVENFAESFNATLPPLKEFVIPGQNEASAQAHLVRCVVRRVERDVVRLSEDDDVSPELLIYLNRLSDAFFIIARLTGRLDSNQEPQWNRSC